MKFKDFKKHKKSVKKKNVFLVGIKIDGQSRELLGWALAEAAEAGDCVIAVHVCRSSGKFSRFGLVLSTYKLISIRLLCFVQPFIR